MLSTLICAVFLFLKTMYKYIVWNTLSYLTQYDYRHYHYHQREHYYLLLHNSNIKAFCAPITNMQTSSSVFILLLSLWNVTSCVLFLPCTRSLISFPHSFPISLIKVISLLLFFTGCLLQNLGKYWKHCYTMTVIEAECFQIMLFIYTGKFFYF